MTIIDTNVLIDVIYRDATSFDWSLDALVGRQQHGPLVVNDIIYAELSVRMESEREVNARSRNMSFDSSAYQPLDFFSLARLSESTAPLAVRA